MKVEYLRYLLEIEKQQSISAAAKTLYIAQTSLSSIVASIEGELNYSIFQRTPKGIIPTKNGERFLELAREMVGDYEEVLAIPHSSTNAPYQMRILMIPSLAVDMPLELCKQFQSYDPKCMLQFSVLPRQEVILAVIERMAGIGLTYLFPDEIESKNASTLKYRVNLKLLRKDRYYLVVSKQHELAFRDKVALHELYNYPLASTSNFKMGGSEKILGSFYQSNIKRTVFPNVYLICQTLIQQPNYIAFLPGSVVTKIIDRSMYSVIDLIDVDAPNEMWISMVYKEAREMRHSGKEAVRFIEEYVNRLPLE